MGLDPEVMTKQQCVQKLPDEPKSLRNAKSESSTRSHFEDDEERLFLDDSYNYHENSRAATKPIAPVEDLIGIGDPGQGSELESEDLLSDFGSTEEQKLESESKPYSKLQPYPQSQNNVSPTSALNLQRFPDESDQLIV